MIFSIDSAKAWQKFKPLSERCDMVDRQLGERLKARCLQDLHESARQLDDVLDRARVLTAAEMLGMAQQVFDDTLAYLKQRVQFNQVLASFQALQHRMADLFADLAQMRSAVEAGLQAVDAGFGIARAATIAKAEANRVMHTMANEGIQLHGGIGMTDEYDVGFYLKRARVLEQSFGSSSWLKDRFSKLSGY